MQKIIPHLWFDKEAKEATAFYASVFPESKVTHTSLLRDTPSGDCDLINFELWGQEFMAISAGPLFQFNPSISFIVNFDPLLFGPTPDVIQTARVKLDMVWEQLSEGGKVLMELGEYPFSQHYGWLQDKYGVSWQLMLTDPEGEPRPPIIPALMFTGGNFGKAEAAIQLYTSVFRDAQPGAMHYHPSGQTPDQAGTVMFADFRLEDTWLAAMDSGYEHGFNFSEAISFMVTCSDQEEIDYYWQQLSAVPEAEQCGWIKDKYGLSWQITSAELETIIRQGTDEEIGRAMQAVMPMKKLDIAAIRAAIDKA